LRRAEQEGAMVGEGEWRSWVKRVVGVWRASSSDRISVYYYCP
jgi:hypothetical protein